jgi:predicted RNA-binding Zn-ribbon protein involved in translation (DUF1610 family)
MRFAFFKEVVQQLKLSNNPIVCFCVFPVNLLDTALKCQYISCTVIDFERQGDSLIMLRDKLERFMYGRYGQDELNRVLSVSALALCGVSLLTGWAVLSSLAAALVMLCLFRAFSRNTGNRAREAEFYFRLKDKALIFFKGLKPHDTIDRLRQFWTYRVFTCPSCGTRCRVPRGKGSVRITCKQCGERFIKKT